MRQNHSLNLADVEPRKCYFISLGPRVAKLEVNPTLPCSLAMQPRADDFMPLSLTPFI